MRAAVMLVVLGACARDPAATRMEPRPEEAQRKAAYWCRADGGQCWIVSDGTREAEIFAVEHCTNEVMAHRREDKRYPPDMAQGNTWCVPTDLAWCFTHDTMQLCFASPAACESFTKAPHDCDEFFDGKRL